MTAVFLRSWGCRLLKGGVGWRGGEGIFRFPPKLTVSHFQMEVEDWSIFFDGRESSSLCSGDPPFGFREAVGFLDPSVLRIFLVPNEQQGN